MFPRTPMCFHNIPIRFSSVLRWSLAVALKTLLPFSNEVEWCDHTSVAEHLTRGRIATHLELWGTQLHEISQHQRLWPLKSVIHSPSRGIVQVFCTSLEDPIQRMQRQLNKSPSPIQCVLQIMPTNAISEVVAWCHPLTMQKNTHSGQESPCECQEVVHCWVATIAFGKCWEASTIVNP